MTRWLKFRIDTAGRNRNSSIANIAYSIPSYSTGAMSFTNYHVKDPELLARDKAPKTLILKQLRNLLSTVFVNAKRIYFSDLHITKDLMNNLMYDKRAIREKKKLASDQDRMDFRFTDLNVFQTVEHVSFVGCTFESKCLNFLSSKLTNLKSILFQSCNELSTSEIEGMFTGRTKSKSIRSVFHDFYSLKKVMRNIDVPSDVALIPLIDSPLECSNDTPTSVVIQRCIDMYGVLSNDLSYILLKKILSSVNEENIIENMEFILKNGIHLFDLFYMNYDFLTTAIVNHYSNTKLWNLLEKYYFYKLPKYSCNTGASLTKSYSKIINQVFIGALKAEGVDVDLSRKNLELFCVDLYEKNFKKDFGDCILDIFITHPLLIVKLADRDFFKPKSVIEFSNLGYRHDDTEHEKAAEQAIQNIIDSYQETKRKRDSNQISTDTPKRTK